MFSLVFFWSTTQTYTHTSAHFVRWRQIVWMHRVQHVFFTIAAIFRHFFALSLSVSHKHSDRQRKRNRGWLSSHLFILRTLFFPFHYLFRLAYVPIGFLSRFVSFEMSRWITCMHVCGEWLCACVLYMNIKLCMVRSKFNRIISCGRIKNLMQLIRNRQSGKHPNHILLLQRRHFVKNTFFSYVGRFESDFFLFCTHFYSQLHVVTVIYIIKL